MQSQAWRVPVSALWNNNTRENGVSRNLSVLSQECVLHTITQAVGVVRI